MPGIVGLITRRPRECAEAELAQMVNALSYEDFYVTGTWSEESLGVYVGWVAQQGSFSDGMPLRNERLGAVLVFSGEEFPEPGMAQRLKEQGYGCDSPGPSYLVQLYEKDPSFPAGLNGRFQGLLADRSRGTAILFNDRYGMHRLYYHPSKDSFYFAAEAKAILAVRPELRRMNPTSLGEFVSCGAVMENRTLFEGIHLLPPASAWVFRNGALQRGDLLLPPARVGRAGCTQSRGLLQGTARSVYSKPPAVLWRPAAYCYVPDRRTRHPDDHGLAEARTWVTSLLHLRRNASRLPGRHRGTSGSRRLRAVARGDPVAG